MTLTVPRYRRKLEVSGTVQGVGFRPFVYRLASELGLAGLVRNTPAGVEIDIEGNREALHEFDRRLVQDRPQACTILSVAGSDVTPIGYDTFRIDQSAGEQARSAIILPDLAMCDDCRRELLNSEDRRYRYPFINCTNCGPRYSIVERLPYDRPNTTMAGFVMCDECRDEYGNPADRRFHAQPNACPTCGPQMAWWGSSGEIIAEKDVAVHAAAAAIRDGAVVAVKGLGGFHLMVDARSDAAVKRLRARKHREEKPLALMYGSIKQIEKSCVVTSEERSLLTSVASPIVLLKSRPSGEVSDYVAPGNPNLGVMLAYTPLHVLLMDALDGPVVATSGNLSDEPICVDEKEAVDRLAGIADFFLVHNRPIVRHVDDSIVRVTRAGTHVLRRARGYAPLPVDLPEEAPALLSVGGHLKNTVAVAVGKRALVSQHVGDLETTQAFRAFERAIDHLTSLYDRKPDVVVHDLHPDYLSTQWARSQAKQAIAIQHHYAHVLSCIVENKLEGCVLGVSFDGTGYGTDGTVWGGEFLRVEKDGFERVASLWPFRLPGGEQAVLEPRRSAMGLLFEALGEGYWSKADSPSVHSFTQDELSNFGAMLQMGLNSPVTSSMGRLFDGVASILGIRHRMSFEGQTAMQLEFEAMTSDTEATYELPLIEREKGTPRLLDWRVMMVELLSDMKAGVSASECAAKFHNGVVEAVVQVARLEGVSQVVLTGGCYQNVLLLERTMAALREAGFRPYCHHVMPTNDGGIALGQLAAGIKAMKIRKSEGC